MGKAITTMRVVAVLLRGRDGKGVGREEAAELAARFGDGIRAVKNHGEWFFIVAGEDDGAGAVDAWSLGQVANHLHAVERGRFPQRPRPGFVLRAEEAAH